MLWPTVHINACHKVFLNCMYETKLYLILFGHCPDTNSTTLQKVRIAALKCIEEMTTLPFPIIIPYRGQITRALEPALDDTKRLVRKQAVSARQEW